MALAFSFILKLMSNIEPGCLYYTGIYLFCSSTISLLVGMKQWQCNAGCGEFSKLYHNE
jgi:hypothetical protein